MPLKNQINSVYHSYGWDAELIYSFLGNWVCGANWIYRPDFRANYTYFNNGFTVTSSANIDKCNWLSFYLQFYRSFLERFCLNVTGTITHSVQSGVIEDDYLSCKTTYATVRVNMNYLISRTYQWRATVDFLYRQADRGLTNNGKDLFNIAASISKDWKCGLRVKIGLNSNIGNPPLEYFSDIYTSYSKARHNPIQLSLGVSYSFGNMRVTGALERQMLIQ